MKQKINFFQEEFKKPEIVFPFMNMAAVLVVAILAICAGALYDYWSLRNSTKTASTVNAERELLNKQVEEKKTALSLVRANPKLQQKINRLKNKNNDKRRLATYINNMNINTGSSISDIYKALAKSDRRGLWLNEITLSEGGKVMSFRGMSNHPDDLPHYIEKLKSFSGFHGVSFRGISLRKSESAPDYTEFYFETGSMGSES